MSSLIHESHKHSENCITVKVARGTQKLRFTWMKKDLVLHCIRRTWDNFSEVTLALNLEWCWEKKRPHKPKRPYDIVSMHSVMIYTGLIEYNIVGYTKAPSLRCLPFISKLKAWDNITNRQYMNYQTFSNLHFRPLLTISFPSIHVD